MSHNVEFNNTYSEGLNTFRKYSNDKQAELDKLTKLFSSFKNPHVLIDIGSGDCSLGLQLMNVLHPDSHYISIERDKSYAKHIFKDKKDLLEQVDCGLVVDGNHRYYFSNFMVLDGSILDHCCLPRIILYNDVYSSSSTDELFTSLQRFCNHGTIVYLAHESDFLMLTKSENPKII